MHYKTHKGWMKKLFKQNDFKRKIRTDSDGTRHITSRDMMHDKSKGISYPKPSFGYYLLCFKNWSERPGAIIVWKGIVFFAAVISIILGIRTCFIRPEHIIFFY